MKIKGTKKAKLFKSSSLSSRFGIEIKDARLLRHGGVIDVDEEVAENIADFGFATIHVEYKKGEDK